MKTKYGSKKFNKLPKGIRELTNLFTFYVNYIYKENNATRIIDMHGNANLIISGSKIKLFYRLNKEEIAKMKQDALKNYKRKITKLQHPFWMKQI